MIQHWKFNDGIKRVEVHTVKVSREQRENHDRVYCTLLSVLYMVRKIAWFRVNSESDETGPSFTRVSRLGELLSKTRMNSAWLGRFSDFPVESSRITLSYTELSRFRPSHTNLDRVGCAVVGRAIGAVVGCTVLSSNRRRYAVHLISIGAEISVGAGVRVPFNFNRRWKWERGKR